MSRSPAKSGKAIATKSLKEKWLSIVQSARENGENAIGGSSTVTVVVYLGNTESSDGVMYRKYMDHLGETVDNIEDSILSI